GSFPSPPTFATILRYDARRVRHDAKRLFQVTAGTLFIRFRYALSRQASEQKRASLRLLPDPPPLTLNCLLHGSQATVFRRLALRCAYHFRCLFRSRFSSASRLLSYSTLQESQ